MLMAKFKVLFVYFFTFLKREIHHYFFSYFKVSGWSIEEMLIVLLPYLLDKFLKAKLI